MGNKNLKRAKKAKNDEFYTQLTDIEQELQHYKHHFKDKVVYCNCDDPRKSNFFKYFQLKFKELGLKKLIATCYKTLDDENFTKLDSDKGLVLEYTGEKDGSNMPRDASVMVKQLEGDGDFRSEESIEFLKEADIIVTNPPFSLYREYVEQLMEYNKKFIIIGNYNSITYKEIFPLLKDNRMWVGMSPRSMDFVVPSGETKNVNASWFTNLDIPRLHEDIILFREYHGNEDKYPRYDNYDAIEVSRVNNIPEDYNGVMGVPITFLTKHNPDQFEIVGITDRQNSSGLRTKKYTVDDSPRYGDLNARSVVKVGDEYHLKYARLLIKRI